MKCITVRKLCRSVMRHRAVRASGFTLVELLTVVVIMGIVALIAIPLFESTDAARVSSAAKLIVSDLQYAQMYSISHSDNPMGLKFDTSTNSYSLVQRSGALPFNCASVSIATNPAGGAAYVTTFGTGRASELTGVSIDSLSLDGDECLMFGSYGELDQATPATLDVTFGGRSLTLSIDPISGEVTVAP